MAPVGLFHNSEYDQFYNYFCNFILSCSFFFPYRENVVTEEVPQKMEALVAEKRRELIEVVSEVDDKLAELFLADEPITSTDLEVSPIIKNLR